MPLITERQHLPQKQGWHLGQYFWISIAVPTIVFLTLTIAITIAAHQEQLRHQIALQHQLNDNANQIRTLLDYELNKTLYLTTGLVSFIQSKQGILSAQELDPWLTNLQEHNSYIRNIGIAPQNKIAFIYPLAGNEAALGLYYPDNKEQWPTVQKTIEGRVPVLAGPTELRQGGSGLIYRVPIYFSNNDYWGLVNTVLNADDFYRILQARAEALNIHIAIQDKAPDAHEKNGIIFGDNTQLAPDVVALDLSIPGRQWQLLASFNGDQQASTITGLRLGGWALALVLSFLLYSFLRSLAQQNRTLLELDESKYRFSQAFNTAPQGMALMDHKGQWLTVNDSLCELLNYTVNELMSLSVYDIIANDYRDAFDRLLTTEHLNPNTPHNKQHESQLKNKQGERIHVILSLAPIQTHTDVSEWIVQVININHRVAVEKLLQQEARYNQAIVDAVIDGIITLDAHGLILSTNPAAEIIFETSRDYIIHQPIHHFIQNPDAQTIMAAIKAHDEEPDLNRNLNHEIIGLRSNGTRFPMELQLSCVYRSDKKTFLAVMRDIGERKRLDHMKSEFISIISHELRTPLTSILGSLRLLDGGALGTFSEQVQKVIRIADQNGKKLALLVNDLLDMDKLIAGKMQFDIKQLELKPLMEQAIESNASYAMQHQVTLDLRPVDGRILIAIDGNRLQQVLANLLSNAAKFSPPQSSVTVQATQQGNKVRIEIIDQGPGISPIDQQKLFQKFYQVDQSNTRKKGGTGLGLAISKELIEAMQGSIGVISNEGHGSCFYIELPTITPSDNQRI